MFLKKDLVDKRDGSAVKHARGCLQLPQKTEREQAPQSVLCPPHVYHGALPMSVSTRTHILTVIRNKNKTCDTCSHKECTMAHTPMSVTNIGSHKDYKSCRSCMILRSQLLCDREKSLSTINYLLN